MKSIASTEEYGIVNGIDFDARYKFPHVGVACYLLGFVMEPEEINCFIEDESGNEVVVGSGEFELVADRSRVVAVMVGDDKRHVLDIEDLKLITEDEYCHSCGQIGCGHG